MRGIINKCTKVNWDNNFKPVGENDITDVVSTHIADIIDDRAEQVFAKENTVQEIKKIAGGAGEMDEHSFGPDSIEAGSNKIFTYPKAVANAKSVSFKATGHFENASTSFEYGFTFLFNGVFNVQSTALYSNGFIVYAAMNRHSDNSTELSIFNTTNDTMVIEDITMYIEGEIPKKEDFEKTYNLEEAGGFIAKEWIDEDIREIEIVGDYADGELTLGSLGGTQTYLDNGEPSQGPVMIGGNTHIITPNGAETFENGLFWGIMVSEGAYGEITLKIKY